MSFRAHWILGVLLLSFCHTPSSAATLTLGARMQVTSEPSYHPRWSPDGARIAFTSGMWPQIGISIVTLEGGAVAPVTLDRGGDLYLSWHPQEDRIAFDGYDAQDRLDLYTVDLGGGEVLRRTTWTGCFGPDWSPDGARLAFSHRGNLWSIAADGTDPVQHTDDAATEDFYPRWSPDGARLAFASLRQGNADIWILELESGAQTRFTQHAGFDARAAWSPDGKWLAWTSDRSGAEQVYAREVQGTEILPLTEPHAEASMPDWKPDGRALCYAAAGRIWVVEVSGVVAVENTRMGRLKSRFR